MQDDGGAAKQGVISTRTAEIVVALLFLMAGAIVMIDSVRVGAGWVDPDGPQAGYFPFRIGAIMSIASLVTLAQAIAVRSASVRPFVDRPALRQVLLILIPATAFVLVIDHIGLYVAAILYITGFMLWIGRYSVLTSVATGVGVAVVLFLMFEVWFLVPLPKGPVEELFGY